MKCSSTSSGFATRSLATQHKQQARMVFDRARQQEIDKLVAQRRLLADKLADWQRTDLGKIVELLRRNTQNSRHFPLPEWRALQPALLARYGKKKSDTVALLERAESIYLFGNRQRHTNSIGMEFVEIVEGEFLMGSPEGVGADNEHPQHRVQITRPFLLGKNPVTVGQFRKFVQATGYAACGNEWQNPGFAQSDNHPVVNVSYEDAVAMAEWLTKIEKETYSLPTEAEWEYACRAGTTTLHYGGDDLAWLRTNANVAKMHKGTTPVGQFAANPWGLHDMLGNCWQWVADWYDDAYYRNSSAADPTGPTRGDCRVLRGGSWYDSVGYCRSGCRFKFVPSFRYYYASLRLCIRVV
jgi:sulfatase modifying factor 1